MPLHIDYRPTKLEDISGNKATIASIKGVLARKSDWPHCWLFTGPSGCGKTTLARIVASNLGVSGYDLKELNIANFRGIDNAREIQEQMRLLPMGGKHRGWILDEVHMATKEFQNAMLKSLEDSPEHVFFFLCTTDPQKLIATVKNRCHEFKVEALSEKEIEGLIKYVIEKENVDIPEEVIRQLSSDAKGSPRAALTTLDRIIDMEPGAMLEAAKTAAFEQSETIELCRALIKREKWNKIATILRGLQAEPEQTRQAILGYCNSILLKEDNPRAWLIMDIFKEPLHYNGKPGLTMACYEITIEK